MKIEQILVQHLYTNKELILEGIGTIRLNPAVNIPTEQEKDFVMPENAFEFDYSKRSGEDEKLIDLIVQKTGKIKPLAIADLESYVILSKQFLNIGKPLVIEGIGTIQKSQQGDYEFIAGNFIAPKIEEAPRQLKEKKEEKVSFESEARSTGGSGKLIIAVLLLALALIGWAIYYFVFADKKKAALAEDKIIVPAAIADTTKKDTVATLKIDSAAIKAAAAQTDTNHFKIVIKIYDTKAAAEKAYNRLSSYGHKLELTTKDSISYKLAMPFTRPWSDTTKVRDSVKIFFGGNSYIELK